MDKFISVIFMVRDFTFSPSWFFTIKFSIKAIS